MNRRKWRIIVISVLALVMLTACHKQVKVTVPKTSAAQFVIQSHDNQSAQQAKLLNQFVEQRLLTTKGLYTNYRVRKNSKQVATGHDLLLESSGLWLTALVNQHRYGQFRQFYKATKNQFDQGNQFSYRIEETGKKADVNATLDDLRVIRALQTYTQLTHSSKYRHEAAKRFALLRQTVIKDSGQVADFYNVKSKETSNDSALSYYDLLTLKYFESVSPAEQKLYRKQLAVVKKGYLGDGFPLYASSYNWQTNQYSAKALNTSEMLETLLHLSEVGQLKSQSLSWLNQQVTRKQLYNEYTTLGTVTDRNQSAANYALAAMIFANAGHRQAYQRAMAVVWQGQVTDKTSPIYGGLGDVKTTDAYSYNNLVGLVATMY
jgi:hypothetical protein